MWIEIPAFCHLSCAYCYAGSGRAARKKAPGALSAAEYRDLINAFADAGGKDLAIPGRGEPFHPANEALVRGIIELADRRGIGTTIFTTGETLLYTKDGGKGSPYARRPNTELIDFLVTKKVALFIKCNSRKSAVQDRLVDMEGYSRRRDEAIDLLVRGYGLNRHGRIGIVTSVMAANEKEILELYEYAAGNGIFFDCDTILPLGRGKSFNESSGVPDDRYRAISAELCRRRKITTHPGGTYVGGVCDRIRHHLYVDLFGKVYPCLGARGRIPLGSVRERPLADIWGSRIRQKLRTERFTVFTGVCSRCANFHSGECYSCLGRAVEKVHMDAGRGEITLETRGCFNHRPLDGLK